MRLHKYLALLLAMALPFAAAGQTVRSGDFDVLIKGGMVYDGTGRAPRRVDVAIKNDRIVAIGNLRTARARSVVDASGLAVAPGFINMLSWSTESLIVDGRSQGEVRQGVTTQIMGEGWSMGPLNDRLKKQMVAEQDDIKFDIEGTTLAEYLDLILEDRSRVGTVYFLMSEENLKKELRQPWVSLGSDGASMAPEGVFLKSSTHQRSYGNFAPLLGKYVREEKVISLTEAVRRLTGLAATNLGLDRRGFLRTGMFADVVILDPAKVADTATFENPH